MSHKDGTFTKKLVKHKLEGKMLLLVTYIWVKVVSEFSLSRADMNRSFSYMEPYSYVHCYLAIVAI